MGLKLKKIQVGEVSLCYVKYNELARFVKRRYRIEISRVGKIIIVKYSN